MQEHQAHREPPPLSQQLLVGVLVVVAILFVIAIWLSVKNRDDALTMWATAKSDDLHRFIQVCNQNNGDVDVQRADKPHIVFTCTYAQGRTDEFILQPQ
jgi:hypothetical protein